MRSGGSRRGVSGREGWRRAQRAGLHGPMQGKLQAYGSQVSQTVVASANRASWRLALLRWRAGWRAVTRDPAGGQVWSECHSPPPVVSRRKDADAAGPVRGGALQAREPTARTAKPRIERQASHPSHVYRSTRSVGPSRDLMWRRANGVPASSGTAVAADTGVPVDVVVSVNVVASHAFCRSDRQQVRRPGDVSPRSGVLGFPSPPTR